MVDVRRNVVPDSRRPARSGALAVKAEMPECALLGFVKSPSFPIVDGVTSMLIVSGRRTCVRAAAALSLSMAALRLERSALSAQRTAESQFE